MTPTLRVLLLSDTHLGFDLPLRPRVERRRRGLDFFHTFGLALETAVRERVDLVIHGGDMFHRSRVRPELVLKALELVRPVTEAGIPVVIVPGNHERSMLPLRLLWTMPNLHVLDGPDTVALTLRGLRVTLTGFPFHRRDIRANFPRLLTQADATRADADIRLLCLHHAVEGARVGPSDFTFRNGRDIIPGRAVPSGFAAVLAGHIHRAQILRRDLGGRPLAAPVFYPGSTERTAFAERKETKGFWMLEFVRNAAGGAVAAQEFRELPARPMEIVDLCVDGMPVGELRLRLRRELRRVHPEAVVRVRFKDQDNRPANDGLSAAGIRALAPRTMTVETDRVRPVN